jgi:hypothetical protein
MKFFVTLQGRMDQLLPRRWQFVSGGLLGALLYGMFGAGQGDSSAILIAETAAGLAVGVLVVAAFRYLGRAR